MQIIEITDISAKETEVFSKFSEAELVHMNEPGLGVFIAESEYIISLALDSGFEPICALCDGKTLGKAVISRLGDIPIYTGSDETLKKLTGFNLTEGFLCLFKRKPDADAASICKDARRIVLVERVMNPTNIGAIMRSAAALGIDAFLLTSDCADPLYRRALRVGRGTAFCLPYAYLPKDSDSIGFLKSLGFKSVAMTLADDSINIDDKRLAQCERLAIVLGSEGEGLCEKTAAACDFRAKIPMHGGVDSLNVAAAGAVIFWELTK